MLSALALSSLAPVVVNAEDLISSSTTDVLTTTTTASSTSDSSTTQPSTSDPSTTDASTTESSSSDFGSAIPSTSSTDESSTTDTSTSISSEESSEPKAKTELKGSIKEAIIGTDEQKVVGNTTVAPYNSVVRLEMKYDDEIYYGTGVMIAPNLVLTVAHNVFDQESRNWAETVTVTPAQNGTKNPYGSYTSTTYYIFRRYKTEGDVTPSSYDMAVLKLASNVDSSVGYLPVSTSLSKGARIQIPGYPAETDDKKGYMYTSYSTVLSVTSNTLAHNVDTERGNSGSPILNSSNQVVGVHSAGLYDKDDMGIEIGIENFGRRVDAAALAMIDIAKNNKALTVDVTSNKETKTGVTYRLYNRSIKRHLYTQNLDEANVLKTRGWNFEGAKFTTATSGTPVYRLYSRVTKEHFYTTSVKERDVLVTHGWRYESIAWYSAGSVPVYRLYNRQLKVHLFTTSTNERNTLIKRGWKDEKIAFYVQKSHV